MQQELETIVGRDVDLIERKASEHSHNWLRRKEILGKAKTLLDLARSARLIIEFQQGIDKAELANDIGTYDKVY